MSLKDLLTYLHTRLGVTIKDSNPRFIFTIPGFRIEKYLIPGSWWDYAKFGC